MDSRGFRVQGTPDLFTHPTSYNNKPFTKHVFPNGSTLPTEDSRYSTFSAPMSDGRLVTDYRPSCSTRTAYGTQNSVRKWMVDNAIEIMDRSIQRQGETSGSFHTPETLVPPPAVIQHSQVNGVQFNETHIPGGIGIERADSAAPPLFGTFTFTSSKPSRDYQKHISLTQQFEGGRNTAVRWANTL